jgi:uncharacterized damage-inducible protein DinB
VKRAAKKKPARRAAARTARRGTKKRSAKRVVKRSAKRSAKRASRPKARKAAAKRGAARKPAGRAPLRLVRRRAARVKPAPAFRQREGAAAKHLVLFEVLRARAQFHAAIQGLTPASASRPLAPEKWSVRETVLHLCHCDEMAVHQIEPVSRGTPPPWQGNSLDEDARLNAEGLTRLAHHGWDEALRRLHTMRAELLEALEFVPVDPPDPWSETHPLGRMLRELAAHDRHHADIIKSWRSERGV